ncbi:MAG: D-2-hydroxyacid dehydrogenase [Candidatus Promineifilaceae bacterium]|jgi:phosphoglycerate dehydrogenase-like enzyme
MKKLLLMYGRSRPSQEHLQRLADLGPEVVVASTKVIALAQCAEADAFIGTRYLQPCLPEADNLHWVQSLVAGVNNLASPVLFEKASVVTRAPIFSDVIAIHAVSMAFAVIRRLPEAARMQEKEAWKRAYVELLPAPKTALILGLGMIGREIAAILKNLGIYVRAMDRSRTAEKENAVDQLITDDSWRKVLPDSDLCFVTLPLTKETTQLVDLPLLHALPRHAVLVNVSRGKLVDTQALMQLLEAGELGGAALDVTDPQPPPEGHPLWHTPRLLITPHMASFTPQRQERIERFVEAQVQRFMNGEPLLYGVDLQQLEADALGGS